MTTVIDGVLAMTPAEQRAVLHLIEQGPGRLEGFRPETVDLLLANGRVTWEGSHYEVTTLARYEVDRTDTIPPGEVIGMYDPDGRTVVGSHRGRVLFAVQVPEVGGWFRPWREQVAAVLGVLSWSVAGAWSPLGEPVPGESRRWGVMLRPGTH